MQFDEITRRRQRSSPAEDDQFAEQFDHVPVIVVACSGVAGLRPADQNFERLGSPLL